MGTFLKLTFEARWVSNKQKTNLTQKVVEYIADGLRDMSWQEPISNQLQKSDGHHTNLYIALRLFDIKDIEEGNLKSFTRYKKKDEKLVIDQMLVLNEYSNLPEDEMRIKMCDEIFETRPITPAVVREIIEMAVHSWTLSQKGSELYFELNRGENTLEEMKAEEYKN